PRPRSHMLMRVDLPEGPHLVDVGFGGLTLTGVLALEPDVVQDTPHEPFRLVPAERSGYRMQALVGGEWRSLYWFDLTEQLLADPALGGSTERHALSSPAEIRKVLEDTFLIDTSGLPDLEAALARLFEDR